jgi:hypothetical protein
MCEHTSAYVSIRAVEGSSTAYTHTRTHIIYRERERERESISAHPCHQVMRRGNPHTIHTSTSPLAMLSPFFLRVLEKIMYAPTAYTSYTPAFLLPRYLHTLYRAGSLSRTPAAPPLRLSHAKCVISSTSPSILHLLHQQHLPVPFSLYSP